MQNSKRPQGRTSHCSSWLYSSVLWQACWVKNGLPVEKENAGEFKRWAIFGSVAFVVLHSMLQHLWLLLPARLHGGHLLGQVSYWHNSAKTTPLTPIHQNPNYTHTYTPSRPLPCLSAKRAINTPPPTARSHVMEGKQGMLEADGGRREVGVQGNVTDGVCWASGQQVRELKEGRDKQKWSAIHNTQRFSECGSRQCRTGVSEQRRAGK